MGFLQELNTKIEKVRDLRHYCIGAYNDLDYIVERIDEWYKKPGVEKLKTTDEFLKTMTESAKKIELETILLRTALEILK